MEKFLIVQIKTNNWREEWEKDAKAGWISKNESWHAWSEVNVTQSCPTLWDPLDCSLQTSSVHGIFQARVLEWVAISFSRGSSRPRDQTQVSCTAGRYFTVWATSDNIKLKKIFMTWQMLPKFYQSPAILLILLLILTTRNPVQH